MCLEDTHDEDVYNTSGMPTMSRRMKKGCITGEKNCSFSFQKQLKTLLYRSNF